MDPQRGRGTSDAAFLGYRATRGLFYPHYLTKQALLYRRQLYPVTTEWLLVGTVNLNGTTPVTLKNSGSIVHGNSTGWQYTAARTHGNGYLSEFSEPRAIGFTSGGAVISDLPNAPIGLTAKAEGSSDFHLEWAYDPYGQGGPPALFNVYAGVGAPSYATAEGTVTYNPKTQVFEFDTSFTPVPDGTLISFGVRSQGVAGEEEENTVATPPAPARVTVPTDATTQVARQVG